MKGTLQIATTPTADTSGTTIVLTFDRYRYLIGRLGEGAQRAFHSNAIRTLGVSNIFLTGPTGWESMGGLLGFLLSTADQSVGRRAALQAQGKVVLADEIMVHGTDNLSYALATSRKFILRKQLLVKALEYLSDEQPVSEDNGLIKESWSDANLTAWALPIEPEDPGEKAQNKSSSLRRSRSVSPDSGPTFDRRRLADKIQTDFIQPIFSVESDLLDMEVSKIPHKGPAYVKDEQGNFVDYDGPRPDAEGHTSHIPISVQKQRVYVHGQTLAKPKPLPQTKRSRSAVSYIFRTQPVRGRFLVEEAAKLGVPRGKNFSQLANGQSVTLADGTVVTPEQVMAPMLPGKAFAVVDLPTVEYIPRLLSRPEWKMQFLDDDLVTIVWILGPGVGEDPALRDFMAARNDTEHVISSSDYCPNYIGMSGAATQAYKFNQVVPEHFPRLQYEEPKIETDPLGAEFFSSSTQQPSTKPLSAPLKAAYPRMTFTVSPRPDLTVEPYSSPFTSGLIASDIPDIVTTFLDETRQQLADPESQARLQKEQQGLIGKDVEVITLGTGSALPSKYRNVSATLIRVPGVGSYLLDCGENTLGQLRRLYSPSDLRDLLKDLRMIWISHMHADHHLGTASVIKEWYHTVHTPDPWDLPNPSQNRTEHITNVEKQKLLSQPHNLFLVCDRNMLDWFAEYSNVEDIGYHRVIPLSSQTWSRDGKTESKAVWGSESLFGTEHGSSSLQFMDPILVQATGVKKLKFCPVKHCLNSRGVSIRFESGFGVTYSGDARPSQPLVQIGQDSTLLIHEATFEDDLAREARAKNHSTISEALNIGLQMNAKRVLLTHFSQRYAKVPMIMPGTPKEALSRNASSTSLASLGDVAASGNGTVGSTASRATAEDPNAPDPGIPEAVNAVRRIKDDSELGSMKYAVSFDLMRVKVGEIEHLKALTPAIIEMLDEREGPSNNAASAGASQGTKSGGDANSQKGQAKGKKRQRDLLEADW